MIRFPPVQFSELKPGFGFRIRNSNSGNVTKTRVWVPYSELKQPFFPILGSENLPPSKISTKGTQSPAASFTVFMFSVFSRRRRRLRAERRTGELLKDLARGEGGRPAANCPDGADNSSKSQYAQALEVAGLSTQAASRYQQLARDPGKRADTTSENVCQKSEHAETIGVREHPTATSN